jgi:hypothetical protein
MTAPILAVLYIMMSRVTDETVEGAVEDVQRFIDLTAQAREQVSGRLPLLDSAGTAEAAEEISRFRALKDEARRALWASSSRSQRSFGSRVSSVDEA